MTEVQKQFESAGFEIVEFNQPSDVVLLNTCTVTNNADADSRKVIRKAIRNNPEAFIAVMGCYSQLHPDEIIEIEGVDAVLGTNNKFEIQNLISKFEKKKSPEIFIPDLSDVPFHFASSVDTDCRTRIVFKIQDGCDYVCTYCTIPKARGGSRSMDFNKLKEKFSEMNETKYREVVLSGINLGEYKAPTGENFKDVIRLIAESDFKYRVRISSIEPNLLNDEIIDFVKNSSNLCNHFHIPLQSGSNDVLKKMKRRYNVETFEKIIHKVIYKIPDCGIGLDVIEGFPGETDRNFQETYDLINNLPISYLHVFTYSSRDNTPAANYENQLPVHVRKERTNLLRKLSEKKKSEFIKTQIGSERIVIPEKSLPKDNYFLNKGWTGNYIFTSFNSKIELLNPTKVRILSETESEVIE